MELRRISHAQLKGWLDRYVTRDSVYTPPRATKTRPGNSPSTVNKAVQFLRDVFRVGVENGVCLTNPAAKLEKEQERSKELVIPTREQFRAMIAHVRKGAGWGRRTGDLLEGLAYSGMRIGELRRVRWRHVNLTDRMLSVPGTKSATSLRPLPISAKLDALLRAMRERCQGAGPEDAVWKAKEASVSLAKACAAVGVPHMTHHDLRHFFATKALQKGVPVHMLASWMGHADGGITLLRVYAHYMPEHAKAMAEMMDFD
jgi:integrase